ncbi:Lysine-specific permease [Smittium culicis]|uniref:Lysine-specific permease n=1 Tax=Smittium culicis TaxID=133412 RepID=A0A1R1YIS7_9FUNG|nr:Lysine-specific permease [Smittium culicis]
MSNNYEGDIEAPEKRATQKFDSQDHLTRSLKTRHMSMIALGGTIGTGLFVASGISLSVGGPGGSIVAYVIAGITSFFVMSAIAEMGTYIPIAGSFNAYAARFVDPALSFAVAYNYSYQNLIACANDMVAAGILMQFWLPKVPPIIWSIIAFFIMISLNIFGAKFYGEAEFWFASIKVVAIIFFIITSILTASGVVGGTNYGVSNWHYKDGPFLGGVAGIFKVYVFANSAFGGIEIIGITAGESMNPTKDIPTASRTLFWRILLFYILSILLIGLIIPYDNPSLLNSGLKSIAVSPLVLVLEKAGIKAAADIMNAVILTSVLSAGNTVFFTAPRSLYALASSGRGWSKWAVVTKRGTPIYALGSCIVVTACLFVLSLFGNNKIFTWFASVGSVASIICFLVMLFTHWRFRRGYKRQGYDEHDLPFIAFLYPFGHYFSFFVIFFILFAQGNGSFFQVKFDIEKFVQSYMGIPIFLVFYLGYKFTKKTKLVPLIEIDYETDNYISLGFNNYRHDKNSFVETIKTFLS